MEYILILAIFYLLDLLFVGIMFFAERVNPQKVVIWALVFILLPILGFVIYMCIGQTFYSRHQFRIKDADDRKIAELLKPYQDPVIEEGIGNPKYTRLASTALNTGGFVLSSWNDIRLYTLGQDKFDDLVKDIRGARYFIHMEYFILRDDELGNTVMRELTEKARQGVEVRLLLDYFTMKSAPKEAIREFQEAGGEFAAFHNVYYLMLSPKKNNRNHRKLTCIDGNIAYCGGFNIGDEYLGKGEMGFWRDSAVRIKGPTALASNIRFMMDWHYGSGKSFDTVYEYLADVVEEGSDAALLVSGGPDTPNGNPIRLEYLNMIYNARRTLYLHSPYFMPDLSLRDALVVAARAGVDVRVIIPDKPDHPFVYWNNIANAQYMIENDIRVYHYNNGFVHSKTMVVDGEICSVGSANLDDRSLVHDFETNAMIFSPRIGKEMDEAFMADLECSTELTLEKCLEIRSKHKLKMAFSNLFTNLA